MTTKRIPRKEIAMKFKDGMSIHELTLKYRRFLKNRSRVLQEDEIVNIIRQYMRKQKS